jgi:soluble lytic murein transglycosylase-like protein
LALALGLPLSLAVVRAQAQEPSPAAPAPAGVAVAVAPGGESHIAITPARVGLGTTSAGAQPVRVALGAGGRKLIFNETLAQYARRFAGKLLPVPDLPGLPSAALEPLIQRHASARNLDPRLVRAVIQIESGYNQRARSNKGAMGLMQLMPDTASELAVRDPYDADENLRGGTAYLRQLIDAFPASLEMALAAYNAGPGAVERHRGVPPFPDTIDYVHRVMALYQGTAPAVQLRPGRRPAPYVTRGSNGRLLVTTSVAAIH